jgi:hypothetical protein
MTYQQAFSKNPFTRARVGDFLQNPIHASCVTQRVKLVATGNAKSLSADTIGI